MTKYIEPRSIDEQLLKFAVIDAVMRSEDLQLLLKLVEDLAVVLPDELKEPDAKDDFSITHPDIPSGRTLEELEETQKGQRISFTAYESFGTNTENDVSLEEELAALSK